MPQSDEQQIWTLITDWQRRCIAAYRDTWPGFFEWQAGGASLDGRWTVAHEHHSFADTTGDAG